MALTEEEEFELLSLEREKALIPYASEPPETGIQKLLGKAVDFAKPVVTEPPEGPFLKNFPGRLLAASKEMMLAPLAPFIPSLRKRALNPNLGQYGFSRILEEEGQRAGKVARAAGQNMAERIATSKFGQANPNTAGVIGAGLSTGVDLVSDSLTPSAMQQNLADPGLVADIAGPAIKAAAKPFGQAAAQVGKSFSGVKPNDYGRLFNDPGAILPETLGGPKSIERAGEALGEATRGMQVSAALDPLPRKNEALQKAVEKVMADIPPGLPDAQQEAMIRKNVERLSPQEAYEAYRDTSDLLQSAVEGKNKSLNRVRSIWVDALKNRLSDLSGEYATASKGFARSALRRTFRKPFPLKKYGDASIARLAFSSPILGPIGYALAGPFGAAGLSLAGSSPIVHGAVTAGAGAGAKLAGAAMRNRGFLPTIAAASRDRLRKDKEKKK